MIVLYNNIFYKILKTKHFPNCTPNKYNKIYNVIHISSRSKMYPVKYI